MPVWRLWIALLIAGLLAAGCLGSSSSSDDDESLETSTLSGSVSRGESDDEDDDDDDDDDGDDAPPLAASAQSESSATVRMRSFNDAGEEVDSTSVLANELDGTEAFSGRLDLAPGGGRVLISITDSGYTSFTRRITFDEPSDVDLRAEIRQALLASGQPEEVFTGGPGETLRIEVPAVSGITSDEITASLSHFDSGDPADSDLYPGDYEDAEGSSLAVVAFDYIRLRQGGEELHERLGEGDTGPQFSRRVPASSCSLMEALGDQGDGAAFQVPVRVYDEDADDWVEVALASLEDEDGNSLPSPGTECSEGNARLVWEAPPEGLESHWWSLGYALDDTTELCTRVGLDNQEGEPLVGVELWLGSGGGERSFREALGMTNRSGEAVLTTRAFDDGGERDGNLRFWGYETGDYRNETVDLAVTEEDGSCPAEIQRFEVERSDNCRVEGRVVDAEDGAPRPDAGVWIESLDDPHWNSGFTDDDGEYSLRTFCGSAYRLNAGAGFFLDTVNFRVDGSVGSDEVEDDGTTVRMRDIEFEPIGPIMIAATDGPVPVGEEVEIQVNVVSLEGFYPVEYDFSFPDAGCVGSCSGEFTQEQFESGEPATHTWIFEQSSQDTEPSPCFTQGSGSATDAEGNRAASVSVVAEVAPGEDC